MLVLEQSRRIAGAALESPGESDGMLTAFEISGLDLRGTELVSVAACRIGSIVATADGIAGFRTALLGAGAGAITLGVWDLPAVLVARHTEAFLGRWAAQELPA